MGVKRIVDTSFWTDEKVIEMYSPEDKLFMVYVMTNPHTTQLGIYRLNKRYMAVESGYSSDTIRVLIDRFQNTYKNIRYSEETQELAIKNYLKYSIVKGGKPVEDLLIKEINAVKDKSLLQFVYEGIYQDETLNETVKKILPLLKQNDNDNDNDVSYHDSCNDSSVSVPSSSINENKLLEEEFDKLWELYPKKQGKPKAKEKYIKYRKSKKDYCTYEEVLRGLENYLKHIKQNHIDMQYIKQGSTWFNNKCWLDEYQINDEFNDYGGRRILT
jgi:hypothetical protein